MYYISSDINNDEYCVYDLMYLCIYFMAIKFFHCCHMVYGQKSYVELHGSYVRMYAAPVSMFCLFNQGSLYNLVYVGHETFHFGVGTGPIRCDMLMVETDMLGILVEIITVEWGTIISLQHIRNPEHTEQFIDNWYHGGCSRGAHYSGDRITWVFVGEN